MIDKKLKQKRDNEYIREHYVTWKVTVRCEDCIIKDVEEWCKSNNMSRNEFIIMAIRQALKIGIQD